MTVTPFAPAATLSVHTANPSTYVIVVSGDLDAVTVVRLLRLLDARLGLPPAGRSTTDSIVVDLSCVGAVAPGALVGFKHARHACARRGIDLTLAVDPALADRVAPRDGAELARHHVRVSDC